MKTGDILCAIALALLVVVVVPAQGQVDVESTFPIQGLYEGDGWEITLPDAWRAYAQQDLLVAIPPEAAEALNSPNPAYMGVQVGVTPKSGWEWIEANAYIEGCATESGSFTEVAGQSAKVVDVSCDPEAMAAMNWPYTQLRMYQFFSEHNGAERLHFALAWAASEEIMDEQIASIEQMMDSIRIEGVADIKSEQPELYGLEPQEIIVTANGQEVDLQLQTYSDIQDLKLDESNKTLSFKASSEHSDGRPTVVLISSVLEGPYQVMIDGQMADASKYYTIDDEQTGETEMVVRHGPGQEVAIIGTQVVPEFPLALIVVAIAIGTVTVAGRAKRLF